MTRFQTCTLIKRLPHASVLDTVDGDVSNVPDQMEVQRP